MFKLQTGEVSPRTEVSANQGFPWRHSDFWTLRERVVVPLGERKTLGIPVCQKHLNTLCSSLNSHWNPPWSKVTKLWASFISSVTLSSSWGLWPLLRQMAGQTLDDASKHRGPKKERDSSPSTSVPASGSLGRWEGYEGGYFWERGWVTDNQVEMNPLYS